MLAIQSRMAPDTKTSIAPDPAGAFDQSVMEGATRIIDRKEHLFFEGDVVSHIYKVEAGHVCIYRLLADGRRQVVDFAFPGDFIGLGANGQHGMNAQATEKTRLRCLAVSELRNIVDVNPELGMELYEAIACELVATRELLMSVSHRTAQERIAGFLLALSQRNSRRGEDPATIVLPMTRTDIADFLGLTIETVSRTFSKFRAQGVIELEQCILVTVCDLDRLTDIAEGCDA
jgi:CRP/FNR family transcriptional regulator